MAARAEVAQAQEQLERQAAPFIRPPRPPRPGHRSGRRSGNRITSRIDGGVREQHRQPVDPDPLARAWAACRTRARARSPRPSSAPPRRRALAAPPAPRSAARWSIGSFSSEKALASSGRPTKSSKRSTRRGSSRLRLDSGDSSIGKVGDERGLDQARLDQRVEDLLPAARPGPAAAPSRDARRPQRRAAAPAPGVGRVGLSGVTAHAERLATAR